MLGSLVHFRSLRRIAAFTQEARLPAVAWTNEFTRQGGLMSYGVAEGDQYRRAATYVDRILNGARIVHFHAACEAIWRSLIAHGANKAVDSRIRA